MPVNKGFSLIELAIVLVIIAIIGGVSLSIGSTQMQVAEINNVEKTLDNAKIALATYKIKHGRLPCPANPALASTDTNYGVEVTDCDLVACPAGVVCAGDTIQGAIPFKTIKLSESASYDSWDNKLGYIIDKAMTANASANDDGRIAIMDTTGNEITGSSVLGKATYVLLSHGSDGKGAYNKQGTLVAACSGSESDTENCDGDDELLFSKVSATSNVEGTANYFEDYMEWENQSLQQQEIALPISSPEVKFQKVSANYTVCGITLSDSRLLCWGGNDYGNVGDGTIFERAVPTEVFGGHTDWQEISTGQNHTCGIRNGNRLYCWGSNSNGQLGDNTIINKPIPTEVFGSHNDWLMVSTGFNRTCGIRANNKIYCWGDNEHGAIGDGTTTDRRIPTNHYYDHVDDWDHISTGRYHTCAVRSGNGRCWGVNWTGGLGDNSTSNERRATQVHGGYTDWVKIEAGFLASCGLRSNGQIYCWGRNVEGVVGDGSYTDRYSPTLIASGFSDWIDITFSWGNACGTRSNGSVYCWGFNEDGRLGINQSYASLNSTSTPTQLHGASTEWQQISTGTETTCGVRNNGELYCWGENDIGELGDNKASGHESIIPIKVNVP